MKRLSVHLLGEPQPGVLDHLRSLLEPSISLSTGTEPRDYPGFQTLVAGVPTADHLAASQALRTLIIPWSGLPTSTRTLLLDHPEIAVHNLHHNAGAAAELALALLLAAAKFVVPMDRALRAYDWSPRYRPNPSILLEGRRALILGYGCIGTRVAEMCRGFRMRVTGVRRRPGRTASGCPDPVHSPGSLPELLPGAEALVVCLPLTTSTEGMIGEAELALLPKNALLVNVGRGAVVHEKALFDALRSGRLGGAGLDVWYRYPSEDARTDTPPSAYPFEELDNVVLSPHRAGALGMGESEFMRMEALAASLNAAARGEQVPHRVDVEEGY